ncbi:MAG: hypothetical protein LBS54_06055 [Dysgonamonadaceae bacterium]|jgi:hypothetical protein|nr:hypothetical protein [Dysgonamonadaceae bacterium]
MKTTKKLGLLLVFLCIVSAVRANVTIGLLEAPAKGALLQLKNIEPTPATQPGDANANKGLLLPRVKLTALNSLAPFGNVSATNHVGLLVYNITEDEPKKLKKGVSVWTGTEWNIIKSLTIDLGTVKDLGVKKVQYTDITPDFFKNVTLDSLRIFMDVGSSSQYAIPYMMLTPNVPQGRTKSYNINYLWFKVEGTTTTYNDATSKTEFNNSTNTPHALTAETLKTNMRSEAWIIDDESNAIYRSNYFVVGDDDIGNDRTYTIINEAF